MLRCQFLCHVLKALFFIKIALKLSDFCKKKTQNFRALGAPPPRPPNTALPHCEFLAMRLQASTKNLLMLIKKIESKNIDYITKTKMVTKLQFIPYHLGVKQKCLFFDAGNKYIPWFKFTMQGFTKVPCINLVENIILNLIKYCLLPKPHSKKKATKNARRRSLDPFIFSFHAVKNFHLLSPRCKKKAET